jgi:hypothetical protein
MYLLPVRGIRDKFLFVQALGNIERLLQQIISAFVSFCSLSGQKARAVVP